MSSVATIERMRDGDEELLLPLEKESEMEGFRFVRRMVEEYRSSVNRFDRCGEAFFVAKLSEQNIGICGLNQDPYTHDPTVGRVRRLYVHPAMRKMGVGKLLILRVIEEAKQYYETLTLFTDNPAAAAFYRTIGFAPNPPYDKATHYLSLSHVTEEK